MDQPHQCGEPDIAEPVWADGARALARFIAEVTADSAAVAAGLSAIAPATAEEGGILPPGLAPGFLPDLQNRSGAPGRRTTSPPGGTPGSTAGKMPAAKVAAGGSLPPVRLGLVLRSTPVPDAATSAGQNILASFNRLTPSRVAAPGDGRTPKRFPVMALLMFCLLFAFGLHLPAAEPGTGLESYLYNSYEVRGYVIQGKPLLATNVLTRPPARYTGTNVSLADIVSAAVDLQSDYRRQGYDTMNVVIAPRRITNGLVPLDVFPGAVAQIVVAGERYLMSTNGLEAGAAAQIATALETRARAARAATNRFTVEKYLVSGNTILPPATVGTALAAATNAFGTNVTVAGVIAARNDLLAAYQARGYVTVAVGIPAGQVLTNATIKMQVTEGRLAAITVKGNHYFSSNNIVRALPDLHTNEVLNGKILMAELNQANANQDRQITPVLGPGPDSGTSDLELRVKDRLPLHAKVELNNESSPGTPDLRVNSSAAYNNLWQREQSLGVQYSFSPELYKSTPGDAAAWAPYDQPLVANYSGFYRIPLGRPDSLAEVIAAQPGSFGYDEATRKFNLPPASGQPDLTVYASRSTIDTGLQTLSESTIFSDPGVRTIGLQTVQEDDTLNNNLGFRLNAPLPEINGFRSSFSGGLDFKNYELDSYKTNIFNDTEITYDVNGNKIVRVIPTYNPVPSATNGLIGETINRLDYLPVALRYDGSLSGSLGMVSLGLGLSVNAWYSGSRSNLQAITSSTRSSGHWVTLTPGFNWRFHTNWVTLVRADGQWTSEPLISNEQFGIGGVNSVRGYREGQVFGDTGWHVTLEQQTPAHQVGIVYGDTPLLLRSLVYMDYADAYLLDPRGRPDNTALWGTGLGGVASIGSHWEARFLFSLPLLKVSTTPAYQPFFNFGLTAQF